MPTLFSCAGPETGARGFSEHFVRLIVSSGDVVHRAWEELGPELEEQGYELVEVEFGRQGASRALRLFIDKDGGVNLQDCQAVSQLVSILLDAGDLIEESYVLEVSSPGLDRPIRKPKDFARFVGEKVKLTAHVPVQGRKRFRGAIIAFEDGLVTVDCDGTSYGIHVENVKKANLDR